MPTLVTRPILRSTSSQNLDPGLKVYVEYGVETWNGNFWHEFNYVRERMLRLMGIQVPTATGDLAETNCFNYWSQAFAGQTIRSCSA